MRGVASMKVKFLCVNCGHKLKANPADAGKPCKCTRCANVMTIPESSAVPPWYRALKLAIWGTAAALFVIAAALGVGAYLLLHHSVDRSLSDIKDGSPRARADAVQWLDEQDPSDADR